MIELEKNKKFIQICCLIDLEIFYLVKKERKSPKDNFFAGWNLPCQFLRTIYICIYIYNKKIMGKTTKITLENLTCRSVCCFYYILFYIFFLPFWRIPSHLRSFNLCKFFNFKYSNLCYSYMIHSLFLFILSNFHHI